VTERLRETLDRIAKDRYRGHFHQRLYLFADSGPRRNFHPRPRPQRKHAGEATLDFGSGLQRGRKPMHESGRPGGDETQCLGALRT
jgi:hypothetical protein